MTLLWKYKPLWRKQGISNNKFATVLAEWTPSKQQTQVLQGQLRDHWPPDCGSTLLKEDEVMFLCKGRLGSEHFLQLQWWQGVSWSPKGWLSGCPGRESALANSTSQRGIVGCSSYYLCESMNFYQDNMSIIWYDICKKLFIYLGQWWVLWRVRFLYTFIRILIG